MACFCFNFKVILRQKYYSRLFSSLCIFHFRKFGRSARYQRENDNCFPRMILFCLKLMLSWLFNGSFHSFGDAYGVKPQWTQGDPKNLCSTVMKVCRIFGCLIQICAFMEQFWDDNNNDIWLITLILYFTVCGCISFWKHVYIILQIKLMFKIVRPKSIAIVSIQQML